MNQQTSDNAYFSINAGHPRAIFKRPTDPEEQLTWGAWLKGGLAAIAVSTAVALSWTAGGPVRPLEPIVQMERMAAKVEQTKFIHPNTAHEITRFIDRHWHDCEKAACSTQLQARDRAARNHLKTLIVEKTPSNGLAGIGKQDLLFIDPRAVTTDAITGTVGPTCAGCDRP